MSYIEGEGKIDRDGRLHSAAMEAVSLYEETEKEIKRLKTRRKKLLELVRTCESVTGVRIFETKGQASWRKRMDRDKEKMRVMRAINESRARDAQT